MEQGIIKNIIICDDKNEFPVDDIIKGYRKVFCNDTDITPTIYLYIFKQNIMVLQEKLNENENKEQSGVGLDRFVSKVKNLCKEGTALVCMDYYWDKPEYDADFRNSVIDKLSTQKNLKMIIYTTMSQQQAGIFVREMKTKYRDKDFLIGEAAFDVSNDESDYRDWKRIFNKVKQSINQNK